MGWRRGLGRGGAFLFVAPLLGPLPTRSSRGEDGELDAALARRPDWFNPAGQLRTFHPKRLNSFVRPPEQDDADGLENEIGQPQDQVREPFGPRLQGLAQDKK